MWLLSDFTQLTVSKPKADCFEELISSAGNACTGNAAVGSGYDGCNSDDDDDDDDGFVVLWCLLWYSWASTVRCSISTVHDANSSGSPSEMNSWPGNLQCFTLTNLTARGWCLEELCREKRYRTIAPHKILFSATDIHAQTPHHLRNKHVLTVCQVLITLILILRQCLWCCCHDRVVRVWLVHLMNLEQHQVATDPQIMWTCTLEKSRFLAVHIQAQRLWH